MTGFLVAPTLSRNRKLSHAARNLIFPLNVVGCWVAGGVVEARLPTYIPPRYLAGPTVYLLPLFNYMNQNNGRKTFLYFSINCYVVITWNYGYSENGCLKASAWQKIESRLFRHYDEIFWGGGEIPVLITLELQNWLLDNHQPMVVGLLKPDSFKESYIY